MTDRRLPPSRSNAAARARAGAFALPAAARERFARRLDEALRRSRRTGRRTLVAVTVPVAAEIDASACVLRARSAGDRCFCLEHPARGGFALAGIGAAATVEARGERRFSDAAEACRRVGEGALCDDAAADSGRPPPAGPVWLGGFAFDARGSATPEWSSLAPAQLVMPELVLARQDGEARLTVVAVVDGDEARDSVVERVERRLGRLDPEATMPLVDPDPVASPRVAGAMPPAHYEGAVARAVERIRAGDFEKVVLAREVRVHSPRPIEAGQVLGGLRSIFPACYCYLVSTPEAAFVGASPELLVRRDGARAQSVALAGTTGRSADPAVDDHLGERLMRSAKDREEQAIVARRIERALRPVSLWVAAADEPALVKVHNVQHLATPIRAQLTEPVGTLDLAARLHPTPAVGGEPRAPATAAIPELEGLDRGWYAGALGWIDLFEDGELCVALRCALVRGRVAHLYAGDGIVRDSVPEDELAETEVKLQALLPLLT
jgi:salicylate biosynthesis isochorismate synthase/menaquinone-specific isochorismate synthase